MNPCIVEIVSLSKNYGDKRALNGVTLRLEAGDVLGLLGPNGSGKSTLIKILLGLLLPSEGSVAINGIDISRDGRAARRLMGYVPEDALLYPQMRVGEFLRFMGRLKRIAVPALGAALERVLELLDLKRVQRELIGKLSHGYRQRVLIAQALLDDPPLLILDEPANGLDPQQLSALRALIKNLSHRHTIVLSTHILHEVSEVATRVAVLRSGNLLLDTAIRATVDRYFLRALAPVGFNLHEFLRRLPAMAELVSIPDRLPGEAFELRLRSADSLTQLSRELCAAQCAVLELRPTESDLERRFLELTA